MNLTENKLQYLTYLRTSTSNYFQPLQPPAPTMSHSPGPPILLAAVAVLFIATAPSRTHAIPPADFVIVGAGTAGSAVAGTLCKLLPRATITLLERGRPLSLSDSLRSSSARLMFDSWGTSTLTQAYQSLPNRALNNRTVAIFNGASEGGGSAVNVAQILLPPASTISSWRVSGLSPARANRLFRHLQRRLRGTGIPPRTLLPEFSDAWLTAAAAAGLSFTPDPFRPPRATTASFEGRYAFDRAGRRVDAFSAFVRGNSHCAV